MARAVGGVTYWSRRIDWPSSLMMSVFALLAIGLVAVFFGSQSLRPAHPIFMVRLRSLPSVSVCWDCSY